MTKFLILMLIPFVGLAQDAPFKITGNIGKQDQPARVYLTYRTGGVSVKDSAILNNGQFKFSGQITDPVLATLTLDSKGTGLLTLGKNVRSADIYIEKGDLNVVSDDSLNEVLVSGSKVNNDFKKYNQQLQEPQLKLDNINKFWTSLPKKEQNDSLRATLMEAYTLADKDKKRLQKEYINTNPNSFISLVALKELAGSQIVPGEIEPAFLNLSNEIKNTTSGKEFGQRIKIAKATAIGEMAMDFTQTDTLGKPVSLSDFKGKYVLIDFWASWCGPCRKENPNVVQNFQQYKNKGFTVLGISLDRPGKKESWLKAIADDNLTWTHVSDLKYWDNEVAQQYGIRAIPQNLLIDPNGKIIAKNLRSEKLGETLKELFKD